MLNRSGERSASDLVVKFLEHFAAIRDALDSQGLWDEADGLYYDRLITPAGEAVPVKVRSMVSIIPALAAVVIEVLLDVVFNHTAEGNHLGPTFCFRGLDNPAYDRLDPDDPATTRTRPAAATR